MKKATTAEAALQVLQQDVVKQAILGSGDANFFMRKLGLMSNAGPGEEMKYQAYLKSLKAACAERLVKKIFENDGLDFKFWLGFGKKPFLG